MTREAWDRLWSDPAHWKYGMIYLCPEDPRVWVPKRQKWRGWTLNFARSQAVPQLILLVLFISLPLYLMAFFGFAGTWAWWGTVISIVAVVCLACSYWASSDRYT